MADLPPNDQPDILGALRLVIAAIMHLGNAHETVAGSLPSGAPFAQQAIANARKALDNASALLEPKDEPARDEPVAPPVPPAPPIDETPHDTPDPSPAYNEGEASPPAGTSDESAADKGRVASYQGEPAN